MSIVCIPADKIDEVWPLIVGGITRALKTSNGESSPEQTKQGLKSGATQLLYLEKNNSYFGMVVGLYNFPNYKIARVLLGFGKGIILEREEWREAENWARSMGCACFEAWVATESRARMFARFGFKKTYQIIRSEL